MRIIGVDKRRARLRFARSAAVSESVRRSRSEHRHKEEQLLTSANSMSKLEMSFTSRLFKFVAARSPSRAATMTKHYSTAPSVLYTKIDKRPPEVVRSHGNYLETSDGRTIFDASGGAAVACLGHNEPRVKQAIVDQLDQTAYVYSPFFTVPAAEEVAKYLTESTNGAMSKVFIVSSGMAVASS